LIKHNDENIPILILCSLQVLHSRGNESKHTFFATHHQMLSLTPNPTLTLILTPVHVRCKNRLHRLYCKCCSKIFRDCLPRVLYCFGQNEGIEDQFNERCSWHIEQFSNDWRWESGLGVLDAIYFVVQYWLWAIEAQRIVLNSIVRHQCVPYNNDARYRPATDPNTKNSTC
jgi:hypothetical protein